MRKKSGRLGVGLVGSGFMGKAHAYAFAAVSHIFNLPLEPELAVLAERDAETAQNAARRLGFAAGTGDWRELVDSPEVDVVAIAAPNDLHKPVALAALAAGKHVYCEKPLAGTLEDAHEMAGAAQSAGVVTLVGFNYLRNPMIRLAREIVEAGEIGEIVAFRGIHAEDYMADPETPYSFRHDPEGGGALMDIGSHVVSLAHEIVGPIESVVSANGTVHRSRPSSQGPRRIEVDDHGHFLARFANGALGAFTASWITSGRKMQLDFELTGTRGSVAFTQERFNELRLYTTGQPVGRGGFKTILAGPDHPPYGSFCPAPGHQLGFNDLKIIEVAALVRAIAGEPNDGPDFHAACGIQRVVAAAIRSEKEGGWIEVERM